MKIRKIFLTFCVCVALSGMAAASGDGVVIREAAKKISTPTAGELLIRYPMLDQADNTRAAEKISWYFLRNAEKAEHAFKHGEASNSRKNESLDYKVKLNDGKYLSILQTYFVFYDHAAHPLTAYTGITFDAQSGRKLRWQQVLRPGDEAAVTLQAINAKLFASEYGQKHLFYRDFKGLKSLPENYYLDTAGYIHFLFGQYEIAPYSTGIIDLNMGIKAKN
jgi:hypothetical protein